MKLLWPTLLLLMVVVAQAQETAKQSTSQPASLTSFVDTTYHPKRLILLVGVSAFEFAANRYDTKETEEGLRRGVAVEGNTYWVGSHPSAGALNRRDLFQFGLAVSPSVLGYAFKRPVLFFAGLAGPATLGAKHIYGGNSWRPLITNYEKGK